MDQYAERVWAVCPQEMTARALFADLKAALHPTMVQKHPIAVSMCSSPPIA